jgi:peptidyl-prolyl cis-trans isomerase A (cyclophilin A)
MLKAVRTLATIGVVVTLGAVTVLTRSPQVPSPEAARDSDESAAFTETAPATFQARFETSAGTFTILVTRSWAPISADRFYNLVKAGFYNDCRFFRVVKDFVASSASTATRLSRLHGTRP